MKVYLVGIGMGCGGCITQEAISAIKKSSALIGAERMLESIKNVADRSTDFFICYAASDIVEILKKNSNKQYVSVILSGDSGFFSGAKKLMERLSEYDFSVIPGVSSLSYFCSKIKISWDCVKFLSLHGMKRNIIHYVKYNKVVFSLLSGKNDLDDICKKLVYYNMGEVVLYIAQRLSYPDEKIFTIKAVDFEKMYSCYEFDNLLSVILINEKFKTYSYGEINDSEFIRADIPMTKSEIRSVSICKLNITSSSVVYDIGAGTGSVSVQAALLAFDGEVFAVEKKKEAVELIEKNKRKFATDNISIVCGTAPEILEDLPVPTHVFIGGSSGNLKYILKFLKEKNRCVKIVINAITLETLSETLTFLKANKIEGYEIVNINVSKANKIAAYNMMTSVNPVYIISF